MEFMINSWDSAKRLSTNGAQEFVLYISFNFLNQFFVNFERSDHILFNHYLHSFIYI